MLDFKTKVDHKSLRRFLFLDFLHYNRRCATSSGACVKPRLVSTCPSSSRSNAVEITNRQSNVIFLQQSKVQATFLLCDLLDREFISKRRFRIHFRSLASPRTLLNQILSRLMGKKAIEPFIRPQIVALCRSGMNMSQVSKQLKISRCCVRNAIMKYENQGRFTDSKRSGRPKKLSERDERELKRLVQGENRLSVAKITKDLCVSLSGPVSKETVRRYLKKFGFEYAVKIKKPFLTMKHRKARVEWCKQHLHWTKQDWRKVIFSDESTFYVLKRKNQVKIWRTDDERSIPECVEHMNTGNGGKVGIWGAIMREGTAMARIFDDSMNGVMYCDVLETELKVSMKVFGRKSD